jgi:hypothetical protein
LEKDKELYFQEYDVVIANDGGMEVVNDILQQIIPPDENEKLEEEIEPEVVEPEKEEGEL